jgi:hypothetical protein
MRRWVVCDREGREIYLTEERWNHIISRHGELRDHLDDVLDTVRRGRRQQQPHDPQTYVYRFSCEMLPPPFNGILVVVTFRFEQQEHSEIHPNNFIVTAWGIMMRRKGKRR